MQMTNTTCPICTPGGLGAVCPACLANAPMRRIGHGSCRACWHEWTAPKIGACPRCHSTETIEEGAHTNGLKRV